MTQVTGVPARIRLPQETRAFAVRAASASEPILLLGETGAGKNHLAKYIHSISSRAAGPLQCVNLAAIPEQLFERELFGHTSGAFTDAKHTQKGLFEAAHRGTIILDEIGELPTALQIKLLGVLDDGLLRRIGSVEQIPVDVRFIATTNVDLQHAVASGTFRHDLFFRLNVLSHSLTPLRARRREISDLISNLIDEYGAGRPVTVSKVALEFLMSYSWPGNIRELSNTLRRILTLVDSALIEPKHLPKEIISPHWRATGEHMAQGGYPRRYVAPTDEATERKRIMDALTAEDGIRSKAAARLGMSRTTLWYKIKEHGIDVS